MLISSFFAFTIKVWIRKGNGSKSFIELLSKQIHWCMDDALKLTENFNKIQLDACRIIRSFRINTIFCFLPLSKNVNTVLKASFHKLQPIIWVNDNMKHGTNLTQKEKSLPSFDLFL